MCLFWLIRSLGVRIFELRCLGVRNFGWLVRSLGVWIFGLRCLGVRNFGFTVFWLAGYLGVRIPGFTVPLDLRILQHTWISGSMCGCLLRVVWFFGFFLGRMARW
jgi:hypothetical protein